MTATMVGETTEQMMRSLLQAGVHFGHQTKRWNPKMAPYIFGERDGIHIIDLHQTALLIQEAQDFLREIAEAGEKIIFVGTKKQAVDVVAEQAARCGMFYVNRRWLGGTLTNFRTIRGRLNDLRRLEQEQLVGAFDVLPRQEAMAREDELERLQRKLGGLKNLNQLPGALIVVDPNRETLAVKEANRLNIPIVAIVDTNCDPDEIDYVIPGNDDSIRSIRLILSSLTDAIIEGLTRRESQYADAPPADADEQAYAEWAASDADADEGDAADDE
ncbi:MAG TPA: 30S ribosomal protein S2 [Thermomicrobiales bacterium]|nr:30S ribosomal protein S2 [Thermomicrobiales bacterium]